MKSARNARQNGVTLIESAVATCIMALLTSQLAPGMQGAMQRRALEGSAMQLRTDMQYARSLAVTHNQGVRISFDAQVGAGCYVVHTGTANQCTCADDGAPLCQGEAQALRTVRLDAKQGISLQSNVRSILFDPARGTSTPTGTVRLKSKLAGSLHQVVNIMGRIRTCSPAPALAGYATC